MTNLIDNKKFRAVVFASGNYFCFFHETKKDKPKLLKIQSRRWDETARRVVGLPGYYYLEGITTEGSAGESDSSFVVTDALPLASEADAEALNRELYFELKLAKKVGASGTSQLRQVVEPKQNPALVY